MKDETIFYKFLHYIYSLFNYVENKIIAFHVRTQCLLKNNDTDA